MKILTNKVVAICILFLGINVVAQNQIKEQSIHAEFLLSSTMLEDAYLDISFINSMNITSNKHILLSSTSQFYLLGLGGIKPVGKRTFNIHAFDYAPEGILMVVHERELSYLDSIGNYHHYYTLPNDKMGITSGKKKMYVYDQKENLKSYNLYALENGSYSKLINFPNIISSVYESNDLLYVASGNKIYAINSINNELNEVVRLEDSHEKIISITKDQKSEKLYFATNKDIYVLANKKIDCISDQFGGFLKLTDDSLIVFSPERKFLVRLITHDN